MWISYSYEQFRTQRGCLAKTYGKDTSQIDKNINNMAEKRSKLPMEQREIKKIQKALLDIKVGIIPWM